jgi:hemerythrin
MVWMIKKKETSESAQKYIGSMIEKASHWFQFHLMKKDSQMVSMPQNLTTS